MMASPAAETMATETVATEAVATEAVAAEAMAAEAVAAEAMATEAVTTEAMAAKAMATASPPLKACQGHIESGDILCRFWRVHCGACWRNQKCGHSHDRHGAKKEGISTAQ